MRISEAEQTAIRDTLRYGAQFGYGNLISHLAIGWERAPVTYQRVET